MLRRKARAAGTGYQPARVDFASLRDLPAPVERYFRHVLRPGQPFIREAEFRQRGVLRTTPQSERWLEFRAEQLVMTGAPAFVWEARVSLSRLLHVLVQDSYADGVGSGRVRLLSLIPAGSDRNRLEMNSGSLHRYLAEAVWYPTALLPSAALSWEPIGSSKARATLTDRHVSVALEFGFNSDDEVASIYTPGRWGRFGKEYRQTPWEGHFSGYAERNGMLVPGAGEVGWYLNQEWQAVWKGWLLEARYT
jgi:hypothetical protein